MSKIQQETSASVIAGGLIDEPSEISEAISMVVLSTLLQVTKNFGNSYTVNENAFKFVNQRIITFSWNEWI